MSSSWRHVAMWVAVLAFVTTGGLAMAEDQPGCTVTVQPGESIQAAIDAASSGDVICLAEGEWEEHLSIEKSITLRGAEDGVTIRGYEANVPVVTVYFPAEGNEQKAVVLQELTITGGSGTGGAGLELKGAARAEAEDCTIFGNRSGVVLSDTARLTLSSCTITENRHGIELRDSARIAVQDGEINHNYSHGISVTDVAYAEFTDTSLSATQWGMGAEASGSAELVMVGCNVEGNNGVGLKVRNTAQVELIDCTITENGSDGVEVWDSAIAKLSGCSLSDHITGVVLSGGRVEITDSSISRNSLYGIWLTTNARATIVNSTISANGADGIQLGHEAEAAIKGTHVTANGRYGVALQEYQCADAQLFALLGITLDEEEKFAGQVVGMGNRIPGPDEPDGNREGAICPDELAFLMTEEGGELDRREEDPEG